MGLRMGTYWTVTYLFSFLLYFISFILLWIVAAALGFRYFTETDPGIIFIFFFLWGNLLVAFSFFFSVFFNRSRSATGNLLPFTYSSCRIHLDLRHWLVSFPSDHLLLHFSR